MPLEHFGVNVPPSQLDPLVNFLTTSLAHMGIKELMRPFSWLVALGDSTPFLWFSGNVQEGGSEEALAKTMANVHIAFKAENIEQVHKFHEEALKAGGTCNGPPGPRPMYGPHYYAAFVRDPACGSNFEVVFRECDAENSAGQ